MSFKINIAPTREEEFEVYIRLTISGTMEGKQLARKELRRLGQQYASLEAEHEKLKAKLKALESIPTVVAPSDEALANASLLSHCSITRIHAWVNEQIEWHKSMMKPQLKGKNLPYAIKELNAGHRGSLRILNDIARTTFYASDAVNPHHKEPIVQDESCCEREGCLEDAEAERFCPEGVRLCDKHFREVCDAYDAEHSAD